MVVRLVRFNLGSEKLAAAKQIFDDLVPQIGKQPGCKGVTSFGDEATGDYGMFILWETPEASEAGRAVVGPQLSQHLAANNASDSADIRLFEVVDSVS